MGHANCNLCTRNSVQHGLGSLSLWCIANEGCTLKSGVFEILVNFICRLPLYEPKITQTGPLY